MSSPPSLRLRQGHHRLRRFRLSSLAAPFPVFAPDQICNNHPRANILSSSSSNVGVSGRPDWIPNSRPSRRRSSGAEPGRSWARRGGRSWSGPVSPWAASASAAAGVDAPMRLGSVARRRRSCRFPASSNWPPPTLRRRWLWSWPRKSSGRCLSPLPLLLLHRRRSLRPNLSAAIWTSTSPPLREFSNSASFVLNVQPRTALTIYNHW